MAAELAIGLYYLHSKGIVYADLKPSNVLINEFNMLKLCDFGLAWKISSGEVYPSQQVIKYYSFIEWNSFLYGTGTFQFAWCAFFCFRSLVFRLCSI